MILPLPESKRLVKIADTQYNLKTYKNFIDIEKEEISFLGGSEQAKRFEDKTDDEIV